MNQTIGILMMAAGLVLLAVGLLIYFGGLGWFGRLPGDIRIEGESVRIYVPIVSMLLVSLVLSAVLYLASRLF